MSQQTGFGLAAQASLLLQLIEGEMAAQDDLPVARGSLAFVRQARQRAQGEILSDTFLWIWRVEQALQGHSLWIG